MSGPPKRPSPPRRGPTAQTAAGDSRSSSEAEIDEVSVCSQGTPARDRISCARRVTDRVPRPGSDPDERYGGVLEGRFAGEISACAHMPVAKERRRQPLTALQQSCEARHSLRPSVAAKSASPTRGSARSRHGHPIIEVSVADPWEIPGPGARMYGDLESWPMG